MSNEGEARDRRIGGMGKLRRLSGSKQVTGHRYKDLSKTDYSLISRIFIFSILILLLFTLTVLPASAAVQHTLEGYTLEPNPKYTTGNIKGWAEGQCIPFRYTLGNTGGTAESQTIQLKFDNINGAIIGIVDFESFIVPAGTIAGPYFTGRLGYYW